jgi:predicted nicotinamide N-methyase
MQAIDERFVTEELQLKLSGKSIRMLRVTNTDQLYAELVAKGDTDEEVKDERIPYWADLWPSAIALATEVLQSASIKKGTRVLEIGCGLALPGIAAGLKGAEVLMTDYMKEPLGFASINWKMNLPGTPALMQLDWRNPDAGLNYEVILASDIAYEKRSFGALLKTFRTLLPPNGLILLSEPNRLIARDFILNLPSEGFEVKQKGMEVPFHGRNNGVSVYQIRHK